MIRKIFTSESVTEGHPDKISDQISDSVLDAILNKDPYARVACETLVSTGLILVAGEVTTDCYVDIEKIARDTVREIGYTHSTHGFDADTCSVLTALKGQSPDIAMGVDYAMEARGESVDEAEKMGAGDQGMMFGFACDETEELMPLPISLAHRLSRRLAEVRKSGELSYLRPDGKTQVGIIYENGLPVGVSNVVVSSQHAEEVSHETIKKHLIEHVVMPIIPEKFLKAETQFFINPTGRFVIGGPLGDCGLTGRKIIVDTYGGYAAHGGGAFSGKDPTKVDRSSAYMARYVAKNVVASGICKKCEIQVAYAIGVAKPTSISANTYGTGSISDYELTKLIEENFDFRPFSIIKQFDLRRPIYKKTAAYGHFGRTDIELPWEKTDKTYVFK